MGEFETLFSAMGDLGFPTVVSIYLLVRFEGKISSLTISINNLEKMIEKTIGK